MKTPLKQILVLLFFLAGFVEDVLAQRKFTQLGSVDAIVLDIDVDLQNNMLLASTRSEVQLWNLKSKTLLRTLAYPRIYAVGIRGNQLAGASGSGEVFIWNVDNESSRAIQVSSSKLTHLVWLDSTAVAAADDAGNLYRLNIQEGTIDKTLTLKNPVTALSAGFDGSIYVGDTGGNVRVYDGRDFQFRVNIRAHRKWIRVIKEIDKSGNLFTLSDDRTMRRWDPTLERDVRARYYSAWATAADYVIDPTNGLPIRALARQNCKVTINAVSSRYTAKANALVNKIILLSNKLPVIEAVVATHGGGIQVWSAGDMKFKD